MLLGAFVGSLGSTMDRKLWVRDQLLTMQDYPYWTLEGAVLGSLVGNVVSYYKY